MSGMEHAQLNNAALVRPGPGRQALTQGLLISSIIAAITACEYIFAYRNVAYGVVMALALCLLLYVFLAMRPLEDGLTASVETLVLVPLYILFTSSLPWFFISQDYLLPAVYTCILGLCLLYIAQKGISVREMIGIPDKKKLAPYILLGFIGIPLGLVEYLIIRPAPLYPGFTFKYLALNLFYMLFFVALGEEILFRGLIQRNLAALFGWKWGLVATSVLFSIMHLTWRSLPELFFVFTAGLIFGIFYIRTGSLLTSIIIHGVNNTVLVAVYPYVFNYLS
ncbi:MAG: CPBP family intramembrane metalloprotease [Peptococcaceae bacterium]|nr:CPBP family intramembrane metalloprotease [Peptococcaceae bacterium]